MDDSRAAFVQHLQQSMASNAAGRMQHLLIGTSLPYQNFSTAAARGSSCCFADTIPRTLADARLDRTARRFAPPVIHVRRRGARINILMTSLYKNHSARPGTVDLWHCVGHNALLGRCFITCAHRQLVDSSAAVLCFCGGCTMSGLPATCVMCHFSLFCNPVRTYQSSRAAG